MLLVQMNCEGVTHINRKIRRMLSAVGIAATTRARSIRLFCNS